MAEDGAVTVYNSSSIADTKKNSLFKSWVAQRLRGGTIVEIRTVDQAKISEEAGVCSVVVSDLTGEGVIQMPDPDIIKEIKRAVSMPVLVRAHVGPFVEAQILEAIGVDYINESGSVIPQTFD